MNAWLIRYCSSWRAARRVVLADAHVLGRVEVGEVGGERVDEQHLFAGLGVRAHHRVLGVGELRLQRMAFLDRHRGAEARFDAVARAQTGDLGLDVLGQPLVGQHHVGPHRVAADRRALDAAQHAAERRHLAPGGVGVPGVLVAVVGRVGRLVDAHQARIVRIAAGDRVVLQLAEVAGERDVLGARDVLVAEEQHAMLQQQGADLRDQRRVARSDAKVDVGQFGADRAGELLDPDRSLQRLGADDGRRAGCGARNVGRCHVSVFLVFRGVVQRSDSGPGGAARGFPRGARRFSVVCRLRRWGRSLPPIAEGAASVGAARSRSGSKRGRRLRPPARAGPATGRGGRPACGFLPRACRTGSSGAT